MFINKSIHHFISKWIIFLLLFDLIETKFTNNNLKNKKLKNFITSSIERNNLKTIKSIDKLDNKSNKIDNLIKIHSYCKLFLQDFYFNNLDSKLVNLDKEFNNTDKFYLTKCIDDFKRLNKIYFLNSNLSFDLKNNSLLEFNNQSAQLNLFFQFINNLNSKHKRQINENLTDQQLLNNTQLHNSTIDNLNENHFKLNNQTDIQNNYHQKQLQNLKSENNQQNQQNNLQTNAKYLNSSPLNHNLNEQQSDLTKQILKTNDNFTLLLNNYYSGNKDYQPFSNIKQLDSNLPFECKAKHKSSRHFICIGSNITEVPIINEIVEVLTLRMTNISIIKSTSFSSYKNLKELNINVANNLNKIEKDAFYNLKELQSLTIKQAPLLKKIDSEVIRFCPAHISISIIQSGLSEAILMANEGQKITAKIELDNNKITILKSFTFKVKVEHLSINYNLIETIESSAFDGSYIGHLSLKGNNKLTMISEKAFENLKALNSLDLSETSIVKLPTIGLEELEELKIARTFTLKKFPLTNLFKKIKRAYLTYSFHCCAFKFPEEQDEYKNYKQYTDWCQKNLPTETTTVSPISSNMTTTTLPPFAKVPADSAPGISGDSGFFIDQPIIQPSNVTMIPVLMVKFCGEFVIKRDKQNEVLCLPAPDSFNPCEDIMGNWVLRITVWFVLIAALFGNFSVFIILFAGKLPISVSKFLMCNLAIADFLMGVYLLMIAVFDIKTMGQYFNFALDWQQGIGCRIAGFITVFSSELSIYTLTVITMERYFPIAYPLQMHKRLKLKLAFQIMLAGWVYSILMAALPLPFFGISSYSKTSICLPMETRNAYDIAYLAFILCFSAVDFVLICICYGKMYYSIISQKTRATNNDKKVAKGMAMLVFTDFACFMPITFFGLTGLMGYPLIDLALSYLFPLYPFLYTILTKQLRRDFYLLASRFRCKALRSRSVPCAHAYFRYHHKHNAKCLATKCSMNSATSNCQSIPGYSDCINPTNTSNSYSASASQFSNSIYNDSYFNNRCSLDPNSKNRHHGKIQRYYYRNPYPHHHFSVSKQFKENEQFDICCNKYKHKDHKKHMHCYHHHHHHRHHKKHPHSAPVSQIESQSIIAESNSENLENHVNNLDKTRINYLNTNTYLNNALSTSILYNQNVSSCSSSTDYCSLQVGGDHSKCAPLLDLNRVCCSHTEKDKKSLIKCLTLFKHNYLFQNNLNNKQKQNEIGSLTTGTTYDSTFTTTNNPTALTQLSIDSNNHIENRKLDLNNKSTNSILNNENKLINYPTSSIKMNNELIKIELNDASQKKETNTYQSKNNSLANNIEINQVNNLKTSKQITSSSGKLVIGNKSKINYMIKKQEIKEKPIKFKFKLSSNKQNTKTNEIELKKLKINKSIKLINNDNQEINSKISKPLENLEINQANINQFNKQKDDNSLLNDIDIKKLDQIKISKENACSKEFINQQDDHNKIIKTKSVTLDDLIGNQARTKPKILRKWINLNKKKCDYNCHTNFKPIKTDLDTNQKLSNELQINKLEITQQTFKSNELNNDEIKKKHGLLPKLNSNCNNKDTFFNRIFRSLTSSSSSNQNSNPSAHTSDNLTSTSNGLVNDKLTTTIDKTQLNEMKNSKSFNTNTIITKNSTKKLNLSLNSLETSPRRICN